MESITVRQSVRPVRYGFVVSRGDTHGFLTAVSINNVLWGGVFNPIVPNEDDALPLVDAFDPDELVNLSRESLLPALQQRFAHRIVEGKDILRTVGDRRRRRLDLGLGIGAVLRFAYETELKGAASGSRAALFTSVPADWSCLVAAVFGSFEHLPGESGDVGAWYKTLTLASEIEFRPGQANDYGKFLFPLEATAYGLRQVGGWRALASHAVFVGHFQDLDDLREFWNIRASGRQTLFLPIEDHASYRAATERLIKAAQYKVHGSVRGGVVLQRGPSVSDDDCASIQQWMKTLEIADLVYSRSRPTFTPRRRRDWGWTVSDVEGARGEEMSLLSGGAMTPVKLTQPPFLEDEEAYAEHEWVTELQLANPYSSEDLTLQLPKELGAEDLVRPMVMGGHGIVRLGRLGPIVRNHSLRDRVYVHPVKTFDVFKAMLEKKTGPKASVSRPGRYADQIIRKMGSLRFACRAFKVRGVRDVIRRLSNGSTLTKGNMHKIVTSTTPDAFGQNWREDIYDASAGESRPEFSTIFDELLEKRIIRPGMTFSCNNCAASDWYHVSEFSEDYVCRFCFERQRVHFGSSKEWQYKADGLFRIPDSAQGSIASILALWRLAEVKSGFGGRYVTGLNLSNDDGNVVCELDYCFLAVDDFSTEYEFVLGEAKSFMDYEASKIGRLTGVADAFEKTPYIAFATLKDEFAASEKALFRDLLAQGYRVIPLTRLELDPYFLWKRFANAPHKHVVSLSDLAESSVHLNLK